MEHGGALTIGCFIFSSLRLFYRPLWLLASHPPQSFCESSRANPNCQRPPLCIVSGGDKIKTSPAYRQPEMHERPASGIFNRPVAVICSTFRFSCACRFIFRGLKNSWCWCWSPYLFDTSCARFICTLNNFNGQIIVWYISVSAGAIRANIVSPVIWARHATRLRLLTQGDFQRAPLSAKDSTAGN